MTHDSCSASEAKDVAVLSVSSLEIASAEFYKCCWRIISQMVNFELLQINRIVMVFSVFREKLINLWIFLYMSLYVDVVMYCQELCL